NHGDLTLGGNFGDVLGVFAGGSATITASSPITVTKSAVAGTYLKYIAVDDSANDDLVVNAVDLNGDPLFLKAHDDVYLYAGDKLTVQQGALVQAGKSINLVGDYG